MTKILAFVVSPLEQQPGWQLKLGYGVSFPHAFQLLFSTQSFLKSYLTAKKTGSNFGSKALLADIILLYNYMLLCPTCKYKRYREFCIQIIASILRTDKSHQKDVKDPFNIWQCINYLSYLHEPSTIPGAQNKHYLLFHTTQSELHSTSLNTPK